MRPHKKQIHIHTQLPYLLFCKPTHISETWTANRWGITNSKPLGAISMMRQSETLISSQIVFITLFSAGARCSYPITTHRKVSDYGALKPFC
jgi:hypothetical protein